MKISLFKTVVNPHDLANPAHVDPEKAILGIKNGKWKGIVERVRSITHKEDRDIAKKELPAILFGGTFSYRSINAFMEPSNLVCIDFDGMSEEEMVEMTGRLKLLPYVYAVFRSPSNRGIKAVIRAPFKSYEDYKSVFCALDNEFGQIKSFDMANSDISRACFVSYDPEAYLNTDASYFDGYITDWETYLKRRRLTSPEKTLSHLIKWMDNNGYTYKKGERNNYLYVLSSAMCRYGIEQFTAEGLFMQKFPDLSAREINMTLGSAYKRNEFGVAKMTETDPEDESEFYKNLETPDFNFDPASVISDTHDINQAVMNIARGTKNFESFGLPAMDKYLVLKHREMYAFVAGAKAGKTLLISYLVLMAAKYAGWKFMILTTETEIEDYKSTMVSFLFDSNITKAPEHFIEEALAFIDAHFTFITNELDHLQILDVYHYEKTRHNHYQAIVIDPITNVKKSKKINGQGNDYFEELYAEYLRFSKKYCSLWVVSHTISSKERDHTAPYVQDAEYGVHLARRCHYGITFYRDMHDEVNSNKVECHIRYVRTALTKGGGTTMNDSPIEFHLVISPVSFGYDVVVDNKRYKNPLIRGVALDTPAPISASFYEKPQDLLLGDERDEPF